MKPMTKAAIGLALLFALCAPAAQACGYLCTEISENCWGCVYTGDDYSGCRQMSACHCLDEICWWPSASTTEAAVTPEAFGIFAPEPGSPATTTPMTPATR
ncbi:MAG: hypothetical protein ABUT39_00605 [Acidobacteriota bacterium]